MALLADQKFSTFAVGGTPTTGDIIVGLRDGINTKFNWVLPDSVTSITGTADQVLVNGSSGVPVTGAATLSLPQSIATTSSPTFAALTLTNPLTGANGGTGINNGTKTINLGTPTVNYVLTSDASGNATWQSVTASGAITTINGNAGSIIPTAGVVTINGGTTGLTTSGSGSILSLSGTLVAANGGSGLSTLTTFTLLAGGTTATGNYQQVTAGSAGQLLISNGAGVLPSWTTATFPSGSGTLNHLLRSDGTNWVQTTATTLDASDVLSGLTQLNVDNLRLDGNALTSTDTNGNIQIVPNGMGEVLFGTPTVLVAQTSNIFVVQAAMSGRNGRIKVGSFTNGATASFLEMYKSRSTTMGSFVALQSSDVIGQITFNGDDGSVFRQSASIQAVVTGTVSSGVVPTGLNFRVTATTGSLNAAFIINPDSSANLVGALTLGNSFGGGLDFSLTIFPTTLNSGSLQIVSGNNAGIYNNVLTNLSTTSARTWSLPDATGTIALTSQLPSGAALTKTDDTNVTLTLGGTPASALLQAVSLTLGWTGVLSVARGGTGISSFGTGVAAALGQNVNGSGAITLTTSPAFVTPALGVASATSVRFSASPFILDSNGNSLLGQIAAASAVNYATIVNRASGSPPYFLATGADTDIGIGFVAKGLGVPFIITTSNTGFTLFTCPTSTHRTNLIFSSTASVSRNVTFPDGDFTFTGTASAMTNGQIPIGNTGNLPTAATLTAGTGVSITNGAGSITINAIGGGMTWSTTAGTTQAVVVNNGYVSGNAAQSTFTLPATAAVGDRAAVEGLGAGGWILAANTGQTIKLGSSTTSSAGSLTSVAASDNVYVLCIVANTTWRIQTTNSAGLTVA